MRQNYDSFENYILKLIIDLYDSSKPPNIEKILDRTPELKEIEFEYEIVITEKILKYHVQPELTIDRFKFLERYLKKIQVLIQELEKSNWIYLEKRDNNVIRNSIINQIDGEKKYITNVDVELMEQVRDLFEFSIVPTWTMIQYVNNGLMTEEEYRFHKTFRIAKYSFIIAICTLAVTIWINFKYKSTETEIYPTDVQPITTHLSKIEKKLSRIEEYSFHRNINLPSYKIVKGNNINIRSNHAINDNTLTDQFLNKGDLIIVQEEKNFNSESWLRIYYSNDSTRNIAKGWVFNDPNFFY